MEEKPTLEKRVDTNPSFFKRVWGKGKYLVAALGAAYVIHGGYHLIQAEIKDDEKWNLAHEAFFRANAVSSYLDGLKESGMEEAEIKERLAPKFKELDELNRKIDDLIKERDYHHTKAWNPFY